MFIGHFGIGLGAKKAAPQVSLGVLFLAAQLLDLLWPTFLLLDWEHVRIEPGITKMTPLDFSDYPISHSLLLAALWGGLFGLIYFLVKRETRGAVILGLCVVSHWALDLLVHRPDLPLYPGNNAPLVGLGLWNAPVLQILVEAAIFITGLVLYLRATQAKDRVGRYGFWGLIAFLVLVHLSNIVGPPPPDVKTIAWMAQSQWLLVLWAFWIDRHRTAKPAPVGEYSPVEG